MTKAALLFLFVAVATTTLYSCGNSEPKSEGNPFTIEDVKGTTTAAAANGEAIYKRACASCHMAGGDGIANVYPPLAKSDYLVNRENTIKQVINGSSGEMVVNGKTYNNTMPPQQLNDDEVAAVLTYVYTSMGNSGTPVTAAEVAAVRAK
jgi:nitrite reductase (NO-forming)